VRQHAILHILTSYTAAALENLTTAHLAYRNSPY
jgi:hypothetical protein